MGHRQCRTVILQRMKTCEVCPMIAPAFYLGILSGNETWCPSGKSNITKMAKIRFQGCWGGWDLSEKEKPQEGTVLRTNHWNLHWNPFELLDKTQHIEIALKNWGIYLRSRSSDMKLHYSRSVRASLYVPHL